MKKLLRIGILCGVLTLLLCVSAFAEDVEESGVYDLTGVSAAGEAVKVTVTGDAAEDAELQTGGSVDYYQVDKVTYTSAALTDGTEYLLVAQIGTGMPSASDIAYIDQVTGDGSTHTFTIYPYDWDSASYNVYLTAGGAASRGDAVATFKAYAAYLLGETDGNAGINVNDVIAILNHIAGNQALTGKYLKGANVNGDSAVNVNDCIKILNYIARNITSLKGN